MRPVFVCALVALLGLTACSSGSSTTATGAKSLLPATTTTAARRGGTAPHKPAKAPSSTTATTLRPSKGATVPAGPTSSFCTELKSMLLSFASFGRFIIVTGQNDPSNETRSRELHAELDAMTREVSDAQAHATGTTAAALKVIHETIDATVTRYMLPTDYFSHGSVPVAQQSAFFGNLARIATALKTAMTAQQCT